MRGNILVSIFLLALCVATTRANEDDYYASLPKPDAPMVPLTPQPHLAHPDGAQQQASLHTPNKKAGGIDVSHYQGQINWNEVVRNGDITYVYLKATEGSKLVDDTYYRNLEGARCVGLKVGCYHFYSPTTKAQDQFKNMAAVVNLKDHDLIPIIDIEHRGKSSLPQFQKQLRQFLKLVEKHYGVQPILYTSRDFYNKYLSGPFTKYKYMIARYHEDIPQLRDNAAFVMWQYSATSRIRGIRGNVDRSCLMDNYTLSDILLRR
ncbi:MAG: glycosyl hydrolase family 25 [Bacteroidaceae bacterium]|nr:glycosyl hydrolase family 25 [Bacteroidaceae bacterium]